MAVRIRILTWIGCCLIVASGIGYPQTIPAQLHADRVVVIKSERVLRLYSGGKAIKSYWRSGAIQWGRRPGRDHKTPEGEYLLDSRNASSQFYRSIHISYPNARDRAAARQKGVSPGGDVFIHGLPNGYGWVGASHRMKDWTDGCIALTNAEMDEVWQAVPNGTPIEIMP